MIISSAVNGFVKRSLSANGPTCKEMLNIFSLKGVCLAFLTADFYLCLAVSAVAQSFSLTQILGYPYPTELTASANAARLAWVFNERGVRNIWVAEGPEYTPRKLTSYTSDDGEDLVSLAVSADGKWVIYVRGESEGNWTDVPPNATSNPAGQKMQILSLPFSGGEPKVLAEANAPVISPRSDIVAFERDNSIMVVPIDGSAPAKRLFSARGNSASPVWSPDGSRLAYVSRRAEHSFIGVYTNDSTPILWLQPSTGLDSSPRWSPDGKRIAFVRRPGSGGEPNAALAPAVNRWAIWTADASTGNGTLLWKSPNSRRGNVPTTLGGTNLFWGAGGRIAFVSYLGGQSQIYSIAENGGEPLLLTPGNYMSEFINMSPDRKFLIVAGNAGDRAEDIDRRHLIKVPIDRAAPEILTKGEGLEWAPVFTGDGKTIAFISATPQRPPLPALLSIDGKSKRLLGEDRIPRDFPMDKLITPKPVVITAPDGVQVHCQLFESKDFRGQKPAVVYVHGGPPRQMLLGWHYSDYYSNMYALNQYLASKGYVVLSVNYRLGIGYGFDFHNPLNAGWRGASEYQDVKAAGDYLQKLPQVDPRRIGIYGGSYGGFLTAMALARDSNIFAAGVDLHGVHDWTATRSSANWLVSATSRTSYETPPDLPIAIETAWRSSPVSYMSTWRSPVLLIHGDDDRNVKFSQTVDLVARLEKAGVPYEELVLPDEVHGFLRYASWVKATTATVNFLDKYLKPNSR